jgi:hypothetical protein
MDLFLSSQLLTSSFPSDMLQVYILLRVAFSENSQQLYNVLLIFPPPTV